MFQAALLFSFFVTSLNHQHSSHEFVPEKVILVIVDESGTIAVGRDTISSDDLAKYIQERLFKSYMGTGKMYDKILFSRASNNVPEEVTEVVLNEIKEGQRRALRELCTQKYKILFENITKKQQAKLKKQFPVLFQTDFIKPDI
jgi:hypothetical protein